MTSITVLGASGGLGRELVRQALDRGHRVVAVARSPEKAAGAFGEQERLRLVGADVLDPPSIATALRDSQVIVSGLGVAEGEAPGVLTAGARAAVASGARVIWIGALGTGASAEAAGAFTAWLLRTFMKRELPDKVGSDDLVRASGGTVFNAGPMSNHEISPRRRVVTLDAVPRRFFPARVSRATVAAAMLDEAEGPAHAGTTLVPLER